MQHRSPYGSGSIGDEAGAGNSNSHNLSLPQSLDGSFDDNFSSGVHDNALDLSAGARSFMPLTGGSGSGDNNTSSAASSHPSSPRTGSGPVTPAFSPYSASSANTHSGGGNGNSDSGGGGGSSGTGAGLYSHSFLGESHNGPGPISLDIGLGNLPSVEGSESVVGGAGGGFSAGDDDDMTAGLSVNFSSLLFDD